MEPMVFWVRSCGQGREHKKSVRTRLDPHGCLVHNSTNCALYNNIENTGAETAVGSNPIGLTMHERQPCCHRGGVSS